MPCLVASIDRNEQSVARRVEQRLLTGRPALQLGAGTRNKVVIEMVTDPRREVGIDGQGKITKITT
jgi:hypothetical protein